MPGKEQGRLSATTWGLLVGVNQTWCWAQEKWSKNINCCSRVPLKCKGQRSTSIRKMSILKAACRVLQVWCGGVTCWLCSCTLWHVVHVQLEWLVIDILIFDWSLETFNGSSFSNVRTYCLFFSPIILNWTSLGFGLLVRQFEYSHLWLSGVNITFESQCWASCFLSLTFITVEKLFSESSKTLQTV